MWLSGRRRERTSNVPSAAGAEGSRRTLNFGDPADTLWLQVISEELCQLHDLSHPKKKRMGGTQRRSAEVVCEALCRQAFNSQTVWSPADNQTHGPHSHTFLFSPESTHCPPVALCWGPFFLNDYIIFLFMSRPIRAALLSLTSIIGTEEEINNKGFPACCHCWGRQRRVDWLK